MAQKALKNWAEKSETPEGAAAGYDVLRYAKQGFYMVVPSEQEEDVIFETVLDAAHHYLMNQYGFSPLKHIKDRGRIWDLYKGEKHDQT